MKASLKKKILDNKTKDLVCECQINGTTHFLPEWIKPPEDDELESNPIGNVDTVVHDVPEFEYKETAECEFGLVLINVC